MSPSGHSTRTSSGQEFAGGIDSFALGSGAGHCEYFATLLALMLRTQVVPCRLVGGYLAEERAEDGTVVVRGKHAHAWVEVLLPEGIWLTFDPTLPSADTGTGDRSGRWQSLRDDLEGLWNDVARAAGMELRTGETPRELLARARATTAEPRMAELAAAVRRHERARYGGGNAH